MGNQLAVHIDVVVLDCRPECRHIDGDMYDTEKGKSKHCGDGFGKGDHVHLAEL